MERNRFNLKRLRSGPRVTGIFLAETIPPGEGCLLTY
jgi:hypothetical protein